VSGGQCVGETLQMLQQTQCVDSSGTLAPLHLRRLPGICTASNHPYNSVCVCVCVCVCVRVRVCACVCVWREWFALWAFNRKVGSSSPSVGMMFTHHFSIQQSDGNSPNIIPTPVHPAVMGTWHLLEWQIPLAMSHPLAKVQVGLRVPTPIG